MSEAWKAVPFVPKPGAEERVRKALKVFAAAVRADKMRPLTEDEWKTRERCCHVTLD